MAQYPIPQFIEKEGKIVFFLTFRQFFLLIGGGAVCFILLYTVPLYLFFIIGVPIALGVAAVAFVKIDREPILKVLLNFIGFSLRRKNYVWEQKEEVGVILKATPPINLKAKQLNVPMVKLQPSKLAATKKMIETKKWI